ncbi:histone deacetylase HDT1-like isoform X2 [Rhododendron vialii]|uniref:histone deacetylase HDT1-like isoform X2 n=1 Tax=Rhododendron vialii TaxID=182163 RepID=UPI00265EF383|nr:histone deacetylase HDT1-like isoform X2 [Rhododendron vialii]
MEFWGVEVKAGEPLKVEPEDGRVIHISQAALGEGKKGNDIVPLRLKINGKMFVVGSLSGEKFPQVSFDLVLEREFELSHDWKNGSVYFCGYTAENPYDDGEEGFESSDEDEDFPLPVGITGNGTIEAKVNAPTASKPKAAKPESSAKPKVTVVEPEKDDDSDEDDSDDDSDDSDDEDMMDDVEDKDDSEDGDDSEDEEEEETPKKAEAKAGPSKKRATESATKTPVPAKKVKLDTPQKTDGKKGGGHTATPHPSKKTGKSPAANSNKAKEQTPKSEGKVSCKTCNRTFNSDNALESHSKAKHGST